MALTGVTTRRFGQDYSHEHYSHEHYGHEHSTDLRSDVDLGHVDGPDQSTGADLTNVGEDEEDDRDD